MNTLTRCVRRCWIVVPLAAAIACGDSVSPPEEGGLQASAATTGADLDPDGYVLELDGVPEAAVAANGSILVPGLAAGQYEVELTEVAENCAVGGSNPRQVTVAAGGTAETNFVVTCAELVGEIRVTTTTTGEDPDPDGFAVRVDGGTALPIGPDATLSIAGVKAGARAVALEGVAGNCGVVGPNPVSVDVPADGFVEAAFAVACDARVGDLSVTTATTGTELDPDGYGLVVDGGAPDPIGIDETRVLSGLVAGDHTLELTGIAENCAVEGANPRAVPVEADGVAETRFDVTCAAAAGTVRVTTDSWGLGIDPDGYVLAVDGAG
ncbi:MAG: hypothetical protein R6X22_01770, partial [Gemmatimonadota bacterium]